MRKKDSNKCPECEECGKYMNWWSSLGVCYCKNCSIIYDPKKDKFWHTEKEE